MKKILSVVLLLVTLLLAHGKPGYGQSVPPKPNPPRLVNDLAHVMTADQVASLENKLVAYDDSTSVQIVVVTVPTVGDGSIEDYALGILREWGVGNKKTNNGLVILAAIQDRKVYIATGYGLEGSVPDLTAKSIVDNEILPNFKEGGQDNYYRGFSHAADAVIKAVAGEYKAPQGYNKHKGRGGSGGGNIIGLIVIALVVFFLFIGRGGGGRGGGGLFGGGGMLPFLLGTMLGSSSRGGWGGGGSSGWGGGSGGGGGGFGGFGGGSGGGGGAGGSW
jgi:uncharacterized protein